MNTTTTPANGNGIGGTFEERLAAFCEHLRQRFEAHLGRCYPNSPAIGHQVVGVDMGRRFARVWHSSMTPGKLVVCFVDRTTGQVHKADSFKAAGRPVAQNIYSPMPEVDPRVMVHY